MRFGRRPEPDAARVPLSPGERLVRRTGAGLAVFTLALIAILLGAVGLVTAAAAIQATDQSVDSNLHAAAENMLKALAPTATPEPTETPEPTRTAEDTPTPRETERNDDHGDGDNSGPGSDNSGPGSDNSGPGSDNSGSDGGKSSRTAVAQVSLPPTPLLPATPIPTTTPRTAATPSPSLPIAPGSAEDDPSSSQTFFLVVDPSGAVVVNLQDIPLTDLPDQAAVAVALSGNEDWRTVDIDGAPVRLLTEPMVGLDGSITGALQAGFRLSAHQEQQALIVRTIVIASLVGLLGAAVVTLFVTRRALAPIRSAFDSERRFVASASHELKTPVAIIRASAEILQREDLVAADGRPLVDDVVSESDRLGRLVGDLLALASAEAGQISIAPSQFDARALVDDVVDRVTEVARARGVTVEVMRDERAAPPMTPAGTELLVNADRERMVQLLTIFVDNAIEHSPPNGVVRVVARPVMEGRAQRVALEVMDQGPGVPFAERDRIFEPFAKVAGRSRRTGSTGLGLAIARILAARQQATLTVRDAPGGGACFSVTLGRVTPGGASSAP